MLNKRPKQTLLEKDWIKHTKDFILKTVVYVAEHQTLKAFWSRLFGRSTSRFSESVQHGEVITSNQHSSPSGSNLAAMQIGHHVTASTPLQIPSQPSLHPILVDTIQPVLIQALISPQRVMEGSVQPQTPQPPRTCGSSGPAGKSCWSFDVRVAVLLLTLAGFVILLLLYKLLQLRHRCVHITVEYLT